MLILNKSNKSNNSKKSRSNKSNLCLFCFKFTLLGGFLGILPHLSEVKAQELPELPPVYVDNDYGNLNRNTNSLPPVQTTDQGYTTTNPPLNQQFDDQGMQFENPTWEQQQNNVNNGSFQTAQFNDSPNYMVFVDRSDNQTLQRVKEIPEAGGAFINRAFTTDRGFIIQAGLFNNLENARRLQQILSFEGIDGVGVFNRVTQTVDSGNVNPDLDDVTIPPGTSTWDNNGAITSGISDRTRAFYVAVPTRRSNLNQLQSRIQALIGGNNPIVRARNVPKGSHVLIGPFQRHSVAKQWNKYFKGEGIKNSRVYYGK